MRKSIKLLLISLVCITTIIILSVEYLYQITDSTKSISPDLSSPKYFIAHATGSLCGYVYINSRESLESSLENGYQLIEVDLDYTSDSVLVCVHDWEDFNKATIHDISWRDSTQFLRVPSLEEFRQRKIYGNYTPLTLEDVIAIRQQHPFTLVTDRISDPVALNRSFRNDTRKTIMVEAFSEEDYHALKGDGYSPMLSLKLITFKDCLSFAIKHLFNNDIEWIVVDYHSSLRGLRLLKRLFNIKIAAYTVNLPTFFYEHLGKDIDLVYTDNWNLKTQMNTFQNHTTR